MLDLSAAKVRLDMSIQLIGIGKTSIVLRFIGNYFSRSFKPSNGVFRIDHQLYHLQVVLTIRMVDGEQINLVVSDFPGMKRFVEVKYREYR